MLGTLYAQDTSSITGRLFFNYKGDGVQGDEDPAVSGATVGLLDQKKNIVAEAESDSSGDFKLQDVKSGSYNLYCYTNRQFQYMCRDRTDIRRVDTGYGVTLNGQDIEMDIGLMQGFLTHPMSHDTDFTVDRMYDHNGGTDPSYGDEILWWNGPHECDPYDGWCNSIGGTRHHFGIDYAGPAETPIHAAAPGTIYETFGANGIPPQKTGNLQVVIKHPISLQGYAIYTGYSHLSEIDVSVGQQVERGHVIGLEGKTGTEYPHLHFDLYSITKTSNYFACFDPYKPIVQVPDGHWFEDFSWASEHIPIMDENWWTVFNNPQFCV